MPTARLLLCSLLLAAGAAAAQAAPPEAGRGADADWLSYRDAYRAMIWFAKYGKPKQFLQQHYRIVPKEKGASLDGLRLTLNSKSLHLELALDALGRTAFPLSKTAFDENAELGLNRKASQYQMGPALSIVTRADGAYDVHDLQAACAQQLAYLRYLGDAAARGRQCTGVQLSYGRHEHEPQVQFKKADASLDALAATDGGAFWGEPAGPYRVVLVRFAALPDAGQLITRSAPLAISGMFE